LDANKEPLVYIVSDAIGETAELVARAAASQFNSGRVEFRRVSHIDSLTTLVDVVRQASERGNAAIVYTLIVPELRTAMKEETEKHNVPAVDIMGPVVEALSKITSVRPKLEPGLVHRMDEQYFRRIEAVEFAVKCDDGKEPRSLEKADVVLLGVSRTSKTPVSLYLAQRCYKVANIPLVPEVPPPKELFRIEKKRIVGLTIAAQTLLEIRQERLRAMGLGLAANYASLERILHELKHAEDLFRRLGCPVVDVTHRAVEETAAKVLHIIAGGGQHGF